MQLQSFRRLKDRWRLQDDKGFGEVANRPMEVTIFSEVKRLMAVTIFLGFGKLTKDPWKLQSFLKLKDLWQLQSF